MGRFAKPVDIAGLRHTQEVFNSRMKRGEVESPENILRTQQILCGCGAPGCSFISVTRKETSVKEPHYINGEMAPGLRDLFRKNRVRYDPEISVKNKTNT